MDRCLDKLCNISFVINHSSIGTSVNGLHRRWWRNVKSNSIVISSLNMYLFYYYLFINVMLDASDV